MMGMATESSCLYIISSNLDRHILDNQLMNLHRGAFSKREPFHLKKGRCFAEIRIEYLSEEQHSTNNSMSFCCCNTNELAPGTRDPGPIYLLPVESIPCSSEKLWGGPYRSHVAVKTLACPGRGVQSIRISKKPRLGEPSSTESERQWVQRCDAFAHLPGIVSGNFMLFVDEHQGFLDF